MYSTFNRTYNLDMVQRTTGFENITQGKNIIYLDPHEEEKSEQKQQSYKCEDDVQHQSYEDLDEIEKSEQLMDQHFDEIFHEELRPTTPPFNPIYNESTLYNESQV